MEGNIEKELLVVEKLVDMLRHLHQDIENIKREQYIQEYRLIGLTYMLEDIGKDLDVITIDEKTLDEIVNVPPNVYNDAEMSYSPIDNVDRMSWEDHLKSESEVDWWENEKERKTEKFEEM